MWMHPVRGSQLRLSDICPAEVGGEGGERRDVFCPAQTWVQERSRIGLSWNIQSEDILLWNNTPNNSMN